MQVFDFVAIDEHFPIWLAVLGCYLPIGAWLLLGLKSGLLESYKRMLLVQKYLRKLSGEKTTEDGTQAKDLLNFKVLMSHQAFTLNQELKGRKIKQSTIESLVKVIQQRLTRLKFDLIRVLCCPNSSGFVSAYTQVREDLSEFKLMQVVRAHNLFYYGLMGDLDRGLLQF